MALVVLNLTFVISWRGGLWNSFAFDSVATGGRRGWDFYAVYQAGHNLLQGISIYESDNERIDVVVPWYTPYRYLPATAATVGVAANLLRPHQALITWMVVEEAIVLVCAWRSWRLSRTPGERLILAAMWLCFTPLHVEFYLGQFSLVHSALIFATLSGLAQPQGLKFTGTIAWVASLLWKQSTALLTLVYARLGRWRAILIGAASVVIASAPYYAWDPSGLHVFLANLRLAAPAPALGNLGVRQLIYSLAHAIAPGMSPQAHAGLQTAWVLMVLTVGLVATWKGRGDPLLLGVLWVVAFHLLYSDVWEHHYLFLVPVYVLLYRRYRSGPILLGWALTAFWTPYRLIDPFGRAAHVPSMRWIALEPPMLDVAYHACKALPTLFLWAWVLVCLCRRAASPPA